MHSANYLKLSDQDEQQQRPSTPRPQSRRFSWMSNREEGMMVPEQVVENRLMPVTGGSGGNMLVCLFWFLSGMEGECSGRECADVEIIVSKK